jgi:SAM-dependent methyltransferase
VWAGYLSWLDGRAVLDTLGLESYHKLLAEAGLPAAEVDRRMALISTRAFRGPEAMRLWFNSMYGPGGQAGPDWPTPLLMEAAKGLQPGAALDVSMGEGRNSIYLARLGWKVTGFDVSDVALRHAQEKASRAGVTLATVRAGYQGFDFGRDRWDLVVMTYAYFPIRDASYVDRLVESIRPGGLLVFQYGVLKKGADRSGDAALLGIPEEGELPRLFDALTVLRYEEVDEVSDWQTGEGRRSGRTVKMLARKPAP